jgi:hypothetical protein
VLDANDGAHANSADAISTRKKNVFSLAAFMILIVARRSAQTERLNSS